MTLKDRTILVTGAAGGLGRTVVERLLTERATVIGTDRFPEPLDLLANTLGSERSKFHPRTADALSIGEMKTLVQTWRQNHGEIHGLVATVGAFAADGPVYRTPLSTFDRMIDLNSRSFLVAAQAVCESMIAANGGAIIAIGARPALVGTAGIGAYAASKAAVLRLVESLAAELLVERVRVNAVLPSIIDTPTNRLAMPDADPNAWVSPGSLAGVITFLLSDAGKDITGAAIPVYGRS